MKKENFFSKLKKDYPSDKEIERTKEINKLFNFKNRGELTHIYLKSDVLLVACAFEKFVKVPVNEFDFNSLFCDCLSGYTWQCGLKYTRLNVQTLQDEDLILTLENSIRGGISSVMEDRYEKSDENKKFL